MQENSIAPGRFGLSARLLVLTILFVMLAEVLIYVPSVANFRENWLTTRLASAYTAALVLEAAPNGMVPDKLAMQVLDSVDAKMVVLTMGGAHRLLAMSSMPQQIDATVDMRSRMAPRTIMEAVDTLFAPAGRTIRVIGKAPMGGDSIEIVMDEGDLQQAMYAFSRNLLLVSLVISGITAGLVYLALSLTIVRPMRRLTRAMVVFGDNPEDETRIIHLSGRRDEIGIAEHELATMQRQLVDTLHQKSRLAALGLAVAKINHDLRNLLTAAQLFSDRLTTSDDPLVQRFAPKLISALDRAITFCQSTLSYGRVVEQTPNRQPILVKPLINDARELLGLAGEGPVAWVEEIEPGLTIDGDPEQLSRIMLNLTRNALQALEGKGDLDPGRDHIRVTGRREAAVVSIDVADTGPGISQQARERLFEAFSGSTRVGGSGLGLAIAAELVRAHGGTIMILDDGPGATFRFSIPDAQRNGR